MPDFTPYQQKIIKRYYNSQDTIQRQRLAELVSELYLSSGKKRSACGIPSSPPCKNWVCRSPASTTLTQDNPALVAQVVKELEGQD